MKRIYATPTTEIIEMNIESQLLAASELPEFNTYCDPDKAADGGESLSKSRNDIWEFDTE